VIAATLGYWHDRHFRVIAQPAEAELVRSPRDDSAANTVLAATNKCLAQINKSLGGISVTKELNSRGDRAPVERDTNKPAIFEQ
jgi:hypothetical protein